ncbi:MAG: hypothetical protein LBH98_02310 [Chitinispirillales bacterium]|jgi:hypothetical protein|nr:hypothetical protein [Chitinispirillales bacterium]
MSISGISNISWQGYRHKEIGVIVYYDSNETALLPIRTTTSKNVDDDPNYESATYGLYSCSSSRHRANFVKNKYGYVFFMTKYQGRNEKFKDKIMVTGFYKIGSIADVQKLHLRYLQKNSCFSEKLCYALKSSVNEKGENDAVFLSEEDAYILNPSALKSLGIDKKITKATKIELDEEHTKKLLKKFEGKDNKISDYIKQTQQNLS